MRQTITIILKKALLGLFFLSWTSLILSFLFIDLNWKPMGLWMGRVAIITLWIIAIPGIIKRFRVQGPLQQIQIVLMAVRRRLGINMFTFAVMHYVWNRLFVFIKQGAFPDPKTIPLFERLGFTALLLLLPMFVTSNDTAVRLLKKNWQRVHYLIYPAMWLAAFHTALMGGRFYTFALPTYTIAILQLLSRVYDWRLRRISSQSATEEPSSQL